MKTYQNPKVIERFWSKVQVGAAGDCWLWKPARGNFYGQFNVGSKNYSAHKFSMLILLGSRIPDGMWVLHSCDTKNCVNPNHLFLGTAQDNTDDMISKNRHHFLKGEEKNQAKLTDSAVRIIRKLYSRRTGEYTQPKLARIFHVSQYLIHLVTSRKRWNHVK